MKSNERPKDTQREVLEAIRNFIKEHNYSPTIAEVGRIVGMRSKGTVAVHLRVLRELGLLWWRPGCERTFVITDRARVALEVVEAFLEARVKGGKSTRRYLIRSVLCRPEVRAAIEDLMASRGFTQSDAFALHAAHIKGDLEVVRFTREGNYVKVKLPPSFQALRDYWRMTGFLGR